MNCIKCEAKILEVTHKVNSGLCGFCFNRINTENATKNAFLTKEEVVSLAKKYLKESEQCHLEIDDACYRPKWKNKIDVGGEWSVFVKFKLDEGVCMDPDGFFIHIHDLTKQISVPPII